MAMTERQIEDELVRHMELLTELKQEVEAHVDELEKVRDRFRVVSARLQKLEMDGRTDVHLGGEAQGNGTAAASPWQGRLRLSG